MKTMQALLLKIELSRAFLLKFLKFGVVGFSGVFVNFGVTYVCKEWLKWNKYLSNILGFIVAATSNYIPAQRQAEMEFLPQQGVCRGRFHAVEFLWKSVVYVRIN